MEERRHQLTRVKSDHGAHQMDSSAGVKASNEMVTGRKDGKALV